MARAILVIGQSGSGKSRSLKNFKANEVGVIQCVPKDLPFRNSLKTIVTTDYQKIKDVLTKSKAKTLVIDDANYLMTCEYVYSQVTGYDKFNNIATNFYDLINYIQNFVQEDKTVYILMHEDVNDVTGVVKPKTVGKMLDEKVCVEGLFTIVLRCVNNLGEHKFFVNNNGCAKSPEDMFESQSIENDLKYVDDVIREYYGINDKKGEQTND